MSSPLFLSRLSAGFSALFAVGLGIAAYSFRSDLALAQASDSLMDLVAAVVLAWVVQLAVKPGDAGHPLGHRSAEPIGALGLAFVAGVLAVEVFATSVKSLLGEPEVRATGALLFLFVTKALFKAALLYMTRKKNGPAITALHVDARNDVLVGLVAVLGFGGIAAGYPALDAWLSLPVAVWIAWSGVDLARENIHLLMGAAPSEERQRELLHVAEGVTGVRGAHDLRATHLGAELALHVHITVDAELTVREGHDLGEDVRMRLLNEDDVALCTVHVDPD